MKTRRIASQLVAAFGILVTLLVVVGYMGLIRMDEINANFEDILGRRWAKVRLAREAVSYSNLNNRITMEVFLLKDRDTIDALLVNRVKNTERISELVLAIKTQCDSDGETQLLAAVERTRQPYVDSYKMALHFLLDERNAAAASAIMTDQTLPALRNYHDAWSRFLQFQMNQMDMAASERRVRYASTRRLTLLWMVFSVVLAGAIGHFAGRSVVREMRARFRAEQEFSRLNADLEHRVVQRTAELQEHTNQVEAINELIQLLQSCLTLEEARDQLTHVLPRFSPAGALLTMNSSRNLLDNFANWGSEFVKDGPFQPESCWALRRGRVHLVHPGKLGLRCGHVHEQVSSYLCVPMVAQGESMGVLHIQDPRLSSAPPTPELQGRKAFAITLAEQVSLALANLKLRETLKNQSVRDPLTGLFNRRHMEESLEREIQRAARHAKQVSVMMLDLDHFKQFNDTFGHEAGDILLREIGPLLAAGIRGEDIACRYGGEEFIVILADATPELACKRAAMLGEQVRNLQIKQHGAVLRRVTVSIGVAAFPNHGTTASQIINAADKALYEAKAAGRDRVVLAEADPLHL